MTHQTFPKPAPKAKKRRRTLPPRSDSGQSYAEELDAITPALTARSHGICEMCGYQPAVIRHHKLRRSQGGKNTLENLLHLCTEDHDRVHAFPAWAYERGWLLRRST